MSSSSSPPSILKTLLKLENNQVIQELLLRSMTFETEDKWNEKLVMRLLRSGWRGLPDLAKAVLSKDPNTPCVTVPSSLDGRLQISKHKAYPHVIYCQLWRWPELSSTSELRALDHCQYAFNLKKENICVNPYHYTKIEAPSEMNTKIGCALDLSRTTVQAIEKDKEHVLQHMNGGASVTAVTHTTRLSNQYNPNLKEMETFLLRWLERLNKQNISVSLGLIPEKAREFYEIVVKGRGKDSGSEPFVPSRGWLNHFKSLANLHNLELQAASADEEAAAVFPTCLAEIIRDGGYTADQVFNVDETGLFWKRMPSRTYISKEERTAPGHKVSKEKLTVLLGSNASGDFKVKPLLVYLVENPRALQGIFKPQLPVIWKANKKACITVAIFEEWFNDHFLPAVKTYLMMKGLEFKVLLVLDSAPGHPANLGEIYPNVKVVFLPPNSASLLQPMDQGVITRFKAYYTMNTFCNVLKVIKNSRDKFDVKGVWKSYNILNAVKNIESSWNEVKQSHLNLAWKELCPSFVMNCMVFEEGESLVAVTRKIVQYSKKLNLKVDAKDVTELLASHGEELSAEDLMELEKQLIKEEEEAPAPKPRALNATCMSQALALFDQGLAVIKEKDPDVERFMQFQKVIQYALNFYKETVKEKQMKRSSQSKPEIYGFKRKSPAPAATLNPEKMSYPDSTAPDLVEVSPPTSHGLSHSLPGDDPPLIVLDDPPASPALSGETDTEINHNLALRIITKNTVQAITRLSVQHNPNLMETERLLMVWLEDQNQRNVPVSLRLIQKLARELYTVVVQKRGEGSGSEPFIPSRDWFNCFKVRANLHNLKLRGEAAITDEEAAAGFPTCLAEIIRDGGYTADQVFNIEETGLFWKCVPGHMYMSEEEEQTAPDHKVSKERVTVLLGSNASGDFRLKPLLVYLNENQRALKGIFRSQLPVTWEANKTACVTVSMIEKWLNDHFFPAVKKYLEEKGLEFKVLLVLDSAPGHPTKMGEIYPNVEVVYLPPNTASLLQPMNQGVIASFRAYYTRRTFYQVLRIIKKSCYKLNVKEVWKSYSILNAVKNIETAWREVKKSDLHRAWKKLCPRFVRHFEKGESLDAVKRNILQYSKELNLEVEAEYVNELLETHGEELSAEDPIELEKQLIEEEEEAPATKPSAECLSQALALLKQGLVMIKEQDPNVERFTEFEREIHYALNFYKKTIREKQMKGSIQSELEIHGFKRKSPATTATRNPDTGDVEVLSGYEKEEEEEDPDAKYELEPEDELKRKEEHASKPGVELEPEVDLEPEPEHHSELDPTSLLRVDELSQKGVCSYSLPHKDVKSLGEKDFDFSHRQHARDNIAVKKAEDEYRKMGYEDEPMEDMPEVEELRNGYDGSLKSEEIDSIKEESMELMQEPSDKENRQGEERSHFQSCFPDSQSEEDLQQKHIIEVKPERGNHYDGIMKSEEIDIKEELMEPMQEPLYKEDRQEEKRRAHIWSHPPDSQAKKDWLQRHIIGPLTRSLSIHVNAGPPEIIRESTEPNQKPSDERQGEKRQASSQQGPLDSKKCRPENNHDLSLTKDKEILSAEPMTKDKEILSVEPMTSGGFAYVWLGVRGSYGVLRGRVFYEVKVEDYLPVPHLDGEQYPHVVRCGWSVDDAGTLGEVPVSYGYDGRAKAFTNQKYKDYGQPFGKGDIVCCYLNMDSDPIKLSFSLNGKSLGNCYTFTHTILKGRALFPDILTKNCTFTVNYGSEYAWYEPFPRYTFIDQIPLQERVLSSKRPLT